MVLLTWQEVVEKSPDQGTAWNGVGQELRVQVKRPPVAGL